MTPPANSHAHLSIGEVLSLLQEEFPDVTISKIRFLESQGLLDPERTPSGYRKFYEADIDQLRWILTQQKENFLPLKVIKDRMIERDGESDGAGSDGVASAEPPSDGTGPERPDREPAAAPAPADGATPVWMADAARAAAARTTDHRPSLFDRPATDPATDPTAGDAEPAPAPEPRPAGPRRGDGRVGPKVSRPDSTPKPVAPRPAAAPAPTAAASPSASAPPERRAATPLDVGPTSVSLTAAELVSASGLTADQLKALEGFGLIEGRSVGSEMFYDGNALVVAQKSAGFIARGIEPRHLRMFKVAAEREAGFLEQVVMPMVKQRNPAAREQAVVTLGELASMGQSLRAALLRHALRDYLG